MSSALVGEILEFVLYAIYMSENLKKKKKNQMGINENTSNVCIQFKK